MVKISTQKAHAPYTQPPITPQSAQKPSVIVPPPSAEMRHQTYISYEDDRKPAETPSRKRKRDFYLGNALHTKDQRGEADDLVRHFHHLTEEVFEADDESQLDWAEGSLSGQKQYFSNVSVEEGTVRTLSPGMLNDLDTSLSKIVSLRRIDEVSADQLHRLQEMSTGSLAAAQDQDVDIDDIGGSVQQLECWEHGLQSARLILRIMTTGCDDKRLFPEEHLQTAIYLTRKAAQLLIAVVEARNSGPQQLLFQAATTHKKQLMQLHSLVQKVLILLTKFVAREEIAETLLSPLEYCGIALLLAENASSEKESVLGIQKFESLRRSTMYLITTIYSKYQNQQRFLQDEILTSISKLPTGRQAKRQLKLRDGKAIQIFSALMMEFVQATATSTAASSRRQKIAFDGEQSDNKDEDPLSKRKNGASSPSESEDEGEDEGEENDSENTPTQRMSKLATSICHSAARSAQLTAHYLVAKAQTASKTGDQPHRQLLDIFVEDLLEVLGLPDWPAAEIVLLALFKQFSDIVEDHKSLAPAKNMALELLGVMGSMISELVAKTQRGVKALENGGAELDSCLAQLTTDYLEGSIDLSDLVTWNGPYHAVVDYLMPSGPDDLHNSSAQGYYLAQWAKAVASANSSNSKDPHLVSNILKMLQKDDYFPFEEQDSLSDTQAQVAYALTVLNMNLCRQYDYILQTLLRSINTEQPTIRSRALKSVTQMIDKDATLLDRSRDIKMSIGQCITDKSPMVRDNALTLITRCISLRPKLEPEFIAQVLGLINDDAVGVRKRAIKLLKDMYLRNNNKDIRARIGDKILQGTQDLDAAVAELAHQILEEIWMVPLWSLPTFKDATPQNKVALRQQFELLVVTITRSEDAGNAFEAFLRRILGPDYKYAVSDMQVCRSLVAIAFENFLDSEQSKQTIQETLRMLTIFATAEATVFTTDQLQILQPYVSNLNTRDDLNLFKYIVMIFRCILPALPSIQHELLRSIHASLLSSIQKLSSDQLGEVAICLSKITETLHNPEKVLNMIKSCLENLQRFRNLDFSSPAQRENMVRLRKYLWITGAFGKHFDFEPYQTFLKNALTWWKVEDDASVAGLIVRSIKPFTAASHPLSLRAEALQGIGNICQTWPRQFTQKHISSTFADILQKGEPELKCAVLSSFRDFLKKIESQAAVKPGANATANGVPKEKIKLGPSATASDDDGASTLIAQFFLKDTIKVALASLDQSALIATQVIASINRQGLAHPRSSGAALVALGSSSNEEITKVALDAHRILHQQHESALEQDYMRAVQEAFRYQRDVVTDTLGYTARPMGPKLKGLWEVISTSGAKYQKKFLSNFCSRIDFDIAKMDLSGTPPMTLQFSRFLTENLAFFEYPRLDELLHTISCMEKIVSSTGAGLAHSISTEVFRIVVQNDSTNVPNGETPQQQPGLESSAAGMEAANADRLPDIDPARLFVLTTASIVLSNLYEARTFLRRLYGQQQRHAAAASASGSTKTKISATKDSSKAPSRVHGVIPDRFLSALVTNVSSLNSHDAMISQCQRFVDLMAVDEEHRVPGTGADGSEDGEFERLGTPIVGQDDDEMSVPMSGSSAGGAKGFKRKSSLSLSGTPAGKRKRGRPVGSMKRKSSSTTAGKVSRRKSGETEDDEEDEDAWGEEDAEGDWW